MQSAPAIEPSACALRTGDLSRESDRSDLQAAACPGADGALQMVCAAIRGAPARHFDQQPAPTEFVSGARSLDRACSGSSEASAPTAAGGLAQPLQVSPATLSAAMQNPNSVAGRNCAVWAAALTALPAFAGMQSQLMQRVLGAFAIEIARPGFVVAQAAEPCRALVVVLSGSLDVVGGAILPHDAGVGGDRRIANPRSSTTSVATSSASNGVAVSESTAAGEVQVVPAGWACGGRHFADAAPTPATMRVPAHASTPSVLLTLSRAHHLTCIWEWGMQVLLASNFAALLRSQGRRQLASVAQHIGLARVQAGATLCAEGSLSTAAIVCVQGEAIACCYEATASSGPENDVTSVQQQQVAATGLCWLAQASSGDLIAGTCAAHHLHVNTARGSHIRSSVAMPRDGQRDATNEPASADAAPDDSAFHKSSAIMATPGWALVANVGALIAEARSVPQITHGMQRPGAQLQVDWTEHVAALRCFCRPSGQRPLAEVDSVSRLLSKHDELRCVSIWAAAASACQSANRRACMLLPDQYIASFES